MEYGTDRYGPVKTPMLMATLDPLTRSYPEDDTRQIDGVMHSRAYRLIHAPRGSSAYLDQPTITAMLKCSEYTDDDRYSEAAAAYMKDFMERCVSDNGLFFWGNHYYYDAFKDEVIEFLAAPLDAVVIPHGPVGKGHHPLLHELRPLVPNWDAMYRFNPKAVERHIRTMGELHVFDENGGFNRHSDQKSGCAFLEAGAILVHALCFLYSKTIDKMLVDRAMRVARYSYRHRDPVTGLIVNNPTESRWDGHTATTESGFWSKLLRQSADYIQDCGEEAEELCNMAKKALKAYLEHGYNTEEKKYYGNLHVEGIPLLGTRETLFQPDDYSDIWGYLFPAHDYPMVMAMACLHYANLDKTYETAAHRWAGIVQEEAWKPSQRYAENYGRIIIFAAVYAKQFDRPVFMELAWKLASQAVQQLEWNGILVGHQQAKWYDAVDGVGYLLLALLYLEKQDELILDFF